MVAVSLKFFASFVDVDILGYRDGSSRDLTVSLSSPWDLSAVSDTFTIFLLVARLRDSGECIFLTDPTTLQAASSSVSRLVTVRLSEDRETSHGTPSTASTTDVTTLSLDIAPS